MKHISDAFLTNIKVLQISRSKLYNGVEYLANSKTLTNLTHLYLQYNLIGDKGVEYLANSTRLTKLTHLYLHDNLIGDKGAEYLANSTTISNLTYIKLC